MTRQEIDDYIVSIGGLVNGWKGTPIMYLPADCSEGWFPLIKNLIERLLLLGWDKEICQIKEKFGGLRFYINSGTEQQHNIIAEYEQESYKICEYCGDKLTAKIRPNLPWILTLCDECYEKHQNKQTERQRTIVENFSQINGENTSVKEGFPTDAT